MMKTPPFLRDLHQKGEKPEVVLWLGCACSLDDRARKIARTVFDLLDQAGVSFAILGDEERCTGDPARRAGNELLFTLLAMQNVETFQKYQIEEIVTICPHCMNIFRNEYPQMGYSFRQVWHITEYLNHLIATGRLKIPAGALKHLSLTYHDACYLARANGIIDAPRNLLNATGATLLEMEHHGRQSFCCGAGGAQVFKEEEKGEKPVYRKRAEEALQTKAKVLVTACPFCMLMLRDGIRDLSEGAMEVRDISEVLHDALQQTEDSPVDSGRS